MFNPLFCFSSPYSFNFLLHLCLFWLFPVWSFPLACLSGVAFPPWSVNSLFHSALVSVKIDCFRESFCRKKSIIPLILNTLIKILNMSQALLSASSAVFHFILTPFGLKKLDYLPKVTQMSNTKWICIARIQNIRIRILEDDMGEGLSNVT